MAKSKRSRKLKSSRKSADPISRNDQKDEKLRQEKIMPLIEKLSSTVASERAMAISAIISMCEDTKLRGLLLKEKLIQTVMTQSLSDNSEEIVSEAFGLLRNLVAEEGYDVAIFLHRQDILTPIEVGLGKIETSVTQEGLLKMTGEQRNLVFEYFENLLGLISLISAADEEVFEAFDKKLKEIGKFISQKLTLLLQIQKGQKPITVPKSLIDSLLEIVYVLSEANANFINQFPIELANEVIASTCSPISKVHANGFKYNAYVEEQIEKKHKHHKKSQHQQETSESDEISEILSSVYEIISSIDLNEVQNQLQPVIENTEPSQVAQSTKQAIEARSLVNAVQIGLELITAIAETIEIDPSIIYSVKEEEEEEQDEDEDEGMEDISDEQYFEQSIKSNNLIENNDIPNDIEIDNNDTNTDSNNQSHSVIFLNEKIIPLCVSFLPISQLTARSLAALNNVTWTLQSKLPISNENWKLHAEQLWTNLATEKYLKSSEIEITTGCVGILGAVATTFKGLVPVEVNGLPIITTISNQCIQIKPTTPEDEWVEFTTRVILLFKTIAAVESQHEVTRHCAYLLFALLNTPLETPPPVLYESVNAVFDVFGDKSYDYDEPIFIKEDFLTSLKQLLPQLRQVTKKIDKKKNKELRAIGDESTLNLARFIDYKTKERI